MNIAIWLGALLTATVVQLFHEEPVKSYKMHLNNWKFTKGDAAIYSSIQPIDSNWQTIQVPSVWEDAGHPGYDGIAWYRTSITIPESWKDSTLILDLGKVDDDDECYFNGKLIGTKAGWQENRVYNIPKSIINYNEKNIIAVKVTDTTGGGGIYEKTPEVRAGYMPIHNVDTY